MEFKTVQDAFNHYRNSSLEEIENRAAQIKGTIDNDPTADITTINIEIEGPNDTKENIKDNQHGKNNMEERKQFNPITGTNFKHELVPSEYVFESPEYRTAFYKTMLGQSLTDVEERTFNQAMDQQDAERRADAFNTTTNSAAVSPTQTLNEVI